MAISIRMLVFYFVGASVIISMAFLMPKMLETLNSREVIFPSINPVPEFEPVNAIILSEYLFVGSSLGEELSKAIIAADANLVILIDNIRDDEETQNWLKARQFSDRDIEKITLINIPHDSYWLRDFGPLPYMQTYSKDDRQVKFADFIYRNESRLDDTIPYQLGIYLEMSVEHIPLSIDGGNFLTDGDRCFLSVNENVDFNQHDLAEHSESDPYANVKNILRDRFGCREVVLFPDSPHEHIDMWAKVVGKGQYIVNEIDDETMAAAQEIESISLTETIQLKKSLDVAAQAFAQHGKVYRIPMPLIFDKTFRTYANGLLVNGHAFIPKYVKNTRKDLPYSDQSLLADYEKKVGSVFNSLGFKVTFFEADRLIADGGALHCVTNHIPRKDFRRFDSASTNSKSPPIW